VEQQLETEALWTGDGKVDLRSGREFVKEPQLVQRRYNTMCTCKSTQNTNRVFAKGRF
jgi:hypothetical protein